MTYLNKGQFYPVTLKEVTSSEGIHRPISKVRVSSALSSVLWGSQADLTIPESKEQRNEALKLWLWGTWVAQIMT